MASVALQSATEFHPPAHRLLCVNIGCGTSVADGWYNIDNSPTIWLSRVPLIRQIFQVPAWPKNVHRYNVLKGLPFSDGTVDFIYSSHTFEHFTFDQSLALTQECFRALKPGGVLRIVVPDLNQLVRSYLADPAPMASHKFIEHLSLSHTWRDLLHPGAHHQQMFDGRSLLAMLRQAGFENAQLSRYRDSRIPELSGLEPEVRRQESIYVEAQKLSEAQNRMEYPKGA
ncbi:MAG TPA: methyltransferase domain-containing protein [Terriglobales bacterium]|nr:methyltransferase domain-containing protein [Terriglobales bacterium]